MKSRIFHRRRKSSLIGWLLAAVLVLPSLVGLTPMPMRAHAAPPSGSLSAQDATSRLLADLAMLCTPYGLRLASQGDAPAKPAGKIAHDVCVLCSIAAGAGIGVLPVQIDIATATSPSGTAVADPATQIPRRSPYLRPPGQGPPNETEQS